MCLMTYANNKGADQTVHMRSLISTFVVRCLDSIMPLVSISKISRLKLVAVAEQTGLSHTWSKMFEDTFSRDAAHMVNHKQTFIFSHAAMCNTLRTTIWARSCKNASYAICAQRRRIRTV